MIDSSDMIDGTAVCGMCNGTLRKGRFVQLYRSLVHTFCSEPCFRAALREQRAKRWVTRWRYTKRFTIALAFVGVCLTPHEGPSWIRRATPAWAVKVQPPMDPGPPPLPAGWFGPDWPPTEMSLLAALGRDAWLHPLAGPLRRMPRSDARVFGAVRPGNRAIECRNGHCGVDLGGEIWGEHIRAVHDGVVDFVQRGPNTEHGGRFVRLSHRNGTVFTQYFHLAAIPRGLERGVRVKSGDVVGLLGDSGVKESAPHLHFTISVRPSKDGYEKYVDPEPLIALWPLRVPLEGSEVGLVTTVAQAGVPLGSAPSRAGDKRRLAKLKRGAEESAKGEGKKKAMPDDGESASESETSEDAPDE
jgi:murein DD-endopeptidase MepM/ murein hydrolase activator NlpD